MEAPGIELHPNSETLAISTVDVERSSASGSPSGRNEASESQVVGRVVSAEPFSALAHLTALAAAVEALTTGHAKILAGQLRQELEQLSGPSATVVHLAGRARRP